MVKAVMEGLLTRFFQMAKRFGKHGEQTGLPSFAPPHRKICLQYSIGIGTISCIAWQGLLKQLDMRPYQL